MRLLLLLLLCLPHLQVNAAESGKGPAKKIYWLIPSGLRADTGDFNVYKWAREGKLPNLKRMMDEGAYGYSVPDFPSSTPVNYATLITGAVPSAHGVSDSTMHAEGTPLDKTTTMGFSSGARRMPAMWKTLEGKKAFLLSVPGTTPPEIPETTVRGRWGGWGADVMNQMFESEGQAKKRPGFSRQSRLFYIGSSLTKSVPVKPEGEKKNLRGELVAHGVDLHALVLKSGKSKAYNRMQFFLGSNTPVADLGEGQWSLWIPTVFRSKGTEFTGELKIKVVKVWADGNFRVRVLYNNLNRLATEPASAAEALMRHSGPMIDHADNYPAQLIYENEDKELFLDEMRMAAEWHKKTVPFAFDRFKPDIFVHAPYSGQAMMEGRWWLRAVDPTARGYSKERAEGAWRDILEMYQGMDALLGEAMKKAGSDTLVVLSSDHGACPLHKLVHPNNVFAKKGWLKFRTDKKSGESLVDWKNSKVIFLRGSHVYINPDGLAGDWKRATGEKYEKLRAEVIKTMSLVKDEKGVKPLVRAVKWEDVKATWDLPSDRVGDLVLEVRLNYGWSEEMDRGMKAFSEPLISGTSEGLDPKTNTCLWTPFVMWGPGVKKGVELGAPVSHADQLPTIYKTMGVTPPAHALGKPAEEALSL